MITFKLLVENVIDSKDIYTIDELKDYEIWQTNIKNLPVIKKQIQKDSLYQQGARILVPVFDTPDNEITDKIKELININRDSIIKTIKELRVWAKDNITPKRKKELGIKEDDTYIKNSTEPGLGLGTAKTFVEAYSTGILIIPESLSINRKNLHYVHDRIGQKLSISIPNQEYKDFKKIAGWRKIKAYKEFFQFNDKEVEQGWGDIVSGL
jgi:hypothetical protein